MNERVSKIIEVEENTEVYNRKAAIN
jgi:hypothetical protein